MNFRIGQKVVCINDEPHSAWFSPLVMPKRGAVYTIRAIRSSSRVRELQCLLEEIVNVEADTDLDGFGEPHFKVTRFRPLVERKTDISIFTKMLKETRTPALSSAQADGAT